jgi:predicted AlkP superfamily pyrophosphatase or phosphodiesterase
MNLTKIITGLLLLYLSLTLFSCTMQKKPSRIADHVIIFGIDGLSPDGVQKAEAPHLQHFAQEGAYTWHARAVMPSSSGANWSSILNGTTVEQHGVFENSWTPDNLVLPPVAVSQPNTFPTIFAAIRKQLPDAETGAFFHWNPMENFVENSLISRLELPSDQFEAIRLASSYMQEVKPVFTFIQLDQVDSAGHQFGHGSPQYYEAVAEADSLIGELYDTLRQSNMDQETVIIVTSDHGGIGYGHGGNSPQEMQVPFIVFGKEVKKGVRLKQPVNAFDVPATALCAL